MGVIRRAAVAGQFYENNADTLRSRIEGFLKDVSGEVTPAPKALVAPHAGFVYSGPIAASAYATLKASHNRINRVVLLGPCHRVAVKGMALSSANAFETPLGEIEIDQEAYAKIALLPQVQVFDATHEREHSLEVQLPFLQVSLDQFKLVPVVVGETTPEDVAEVIELLWGGDETLIVVSSDLSHYLDYESARVLDLRTRVAIENLDADSIENNGACGRFPLAGLLHVAKNRRMTVKTLDMRNSGDTAGPRNRVVGYGSWILSEAATPQSTAGAPVRPRRTSKITLTPVSKRASPSKTEKDAETNVKKRPAISIKLQPVTNKLPPPLAPQDQETAPGPTEQVARQSAMTRPVTDVDFEHETRQLLAEYGTNLILLSALSIDFGLSNDKPFPVNLEDHPQVLRANGASFVTLTKNGELRGCIGSPQAYRPLVVDVAENAFRAAFEDSRFAKLQADERDQIDISVSLLSEQTPITFASEDELVTQLRAGTDGLVIEDGQMRALFLPSVWNQLPRREDFLRRLKVKAGMPPNYWSDRVRAWRFIAAETKAFEHP